MPYIDFAAREALKAGGAYPAFRAGHLNYLLTQLCLDYLKQMPVVHGQPVNTYSDYNEVIGALECCKLEFYRRAVVPYEDEKLKEHGDVY